MSPLVLRVATRYLVPLILLFSLFLLWRGHHEPGGGFVGGLVAASAFVLLALSEGPQAARRALRFEPRVWMGAGLATALAAGLAGSAAGAPLLTGLWLGKLGTPLVFDVGVYLVVAGVVLLVLLELEEARS
jgi:multicomponent Na+:H+ antiporter subunit B